MTDSPRIYVACLAAYNNGKLHGRWLDAAQDPEDLWAEIHDILRTSPEPGAEEFAIHDYENFAGYKVSEYESIDNVSAIALAIDEHGPQVGAWLDTDSGDIDNLDNFSDYYVGEVESEEQFYADQYEELVIDQFKAELGHAGRFEYGSAKTALVQFFERSIEPYIDTARAARDEAMSDDQYEFATVDGTTYCFRTDI